MYYSKIVNSRVVKGARARVGREKKLEISASIVNVRSKAETRTETNKQKNQAQTKEIHEGWTTTSVVAETAFRGMEAACWGKTPCNSMQLHCSFVHGGLPTCPLDSQTVHG